MKNEFNIYRLMMILFKLKDNRHYDYMKLLKLYYFAEKYHLRTYGFFMNDDDYYAMQYGSVASSTKDILSKSFGFMGNIIKEEETFINDNISFDKDNFSCYIGKQNTDDLSMSAIAAIEFALENFSKFNRNELSDLTHDYVEWKKHKYQIENNKVPRVLESIDDFFLNPDLNDSPYIKEYLKGNDVFAKDKDHTQYVYQNYLYNKTLSEDLNKIIN